METFNFSHLLKGEFIHPTGLYLLVIIPFTIYLLSHKKTNSIEFCFFENHSLYVESCPVADK